MREKTSIADKYLLEHFYGTCFQSSKASIRCSGVDFSNEGYSWLDVILVGENKCGNCVHVAERQGFYYGKGRFSSSFEKQKYVTLNNIRSQEEFEKVCSRINEDVRGIHVRGAAADAFPFERYKNLEFVVLTDHRIERFWDMSKNPCLRVLTIYENRHLKSLEGLQEAENLECIQFLTCTSSVNTAKINSLKPISNLLNLKEVILSSTEPTDHNIDYLINLPSLEYLWISPNLFPTECYAKFEAKKFMLSDEYGIYLDEGDDIFPYGKGRHIMHTQQQKQKYLKEYERLLELYK